MYKKEDILQAAQDIRPFLKELAGDEAEKIGQELDELLIQFQIGAKTETDILRFLKKNEKTKKWTAKFFENKGYSADGTRMFSELPGRYADFPGKPSQPGGGMKKYVCPEKDCKEYGYLRDIGEEIPECPIHRKRLISERK
jgi:hypothetical protein